jgi:hypothetical protein
MSFTKKVNGMGVDVYSPVKKQNIRGIDETAEAKFFYGRAMIKWPKECFTLRHITNEGKRSPRVASDLAQSGLVSGTSDYILQRASKHYGSLAIELKVESGKNYAKKDQNEYILGVIDGGGYACVCNGGRAALYILERYLNNEKF